MCVRILAELTPGSSLGERAMFHCKGPMPASALIRPGVAVAPGISPGPGLGATRGVARSWGAPQFELGCVGARAAIRARWARLPG